MKDKGIAKAFTMFIVSILTLAVSVFAWIATSQQANIGTIIGQTADFNAILIFDVKKNDETTWTEIETIDDMHEFFGNTIPNDHIYFKIDIENTGNKDFYADVVIRNLFSEVSFAGFDMLDVYYLDNGLITIVYDDPNIADEVVPLFKTPDSTPVIKHDQTLNVYRFSNLIDEHHNFTVIHQHFVPINTSLSIYFTIVYDEFTSKNEYESGIFHLNSIYVYLN